ncbi:MAG: hypothetical protein HOV81_27200 [Kofleriaceae bacterium]|nr:hypothetical protein [Kofleriaceae bacterium]
MSAAVGADVEALCSKCGDVWHVVVAKVGEQIVKVQCKQCGGYHRFKSPHGQPKEKRMPSAFAPKPPRNSGMTSGEKAPVERFEKPAVAADLTKPTRQYAASLKFEVGERIEHVSFGQGVVEVSEPGKVTVFFASGRRVLVQSKESGAPAQKLERPKPFDHSNTAGGKPVSES